MPPVTADVPFDCPRCFSELHGYEDDDMVWIECHRCGWTIGATHAMLGGGELDEKTIFQEGPFP